ncbi:MAG: O-antigen ligase family protein [Kiritimatiellia bacterium]
MIWGLYYLVSFTLGQNPAYMQATIWIGTALVGLFTLPVFLRRVRLRDVPQEWFLLGGFFVWALLGGFFAENMTLFARHLKMVFEFVMLLLFVSVILKNSGGVQWFYLAFVGVAVLRIVSGEDPISIARIADTQVVARITSANAIGYYCAVGIIGTLALLRETRRFWMRGLLVGAAGVALYGVVLSASRGAMLVLMATAVLWPAMCLVGAGRFKVKAIAGAIIVLALSYWTFQFIIQNTYMGVRFTNAAQLEDGSSQQRLELVLIGLRMFAKNPLIGNGLGQFSTVSGMGRYAHNELAEIASATGIPGLILYYSIYWMAWRRLSWSLRFLGDPLTRYRVNVIRMLLLILLLSGAVSRPVFLTQDGMFLVGIVVGMAHWAERMARAESRQAVPGSAPAWGLPGFPVRPGPAAQTYAFGSPRHPDVVPG